MNTIRILLAILIALYAANLIYFEIVRYRLKKMQYEYQKLRDLYRRAYQQLFKRSK